MRHTSQMTPRSSNALPAHAEWSRLNMPARDDLDDLGLALAGTIPACAGEHFP